MSWSSAQEPLLWFDQGRPTPQAVEATQILASAYLDGLVPADYDAEPLQQAVTQAAQGPVQSADTQIQLDAALTTAMGRYLLDLHQGRLDPRVLHQYFKASPLPENFDPIAYLHAAVTSGRLAEAVYLAAPHILLYAKLRKALADYRQLLGHPAWNTELPPIPGKRLEPGQTYDGLAMLTQRLVALGDLPANTSTPERYEGVLMQGVQAFQLRHGLEPDGILGNATFVDLQAPIARRVRQIELTLERLRWTPLLQAPRMITVNIPEFMLQTYEVKDGKATVVERMRIIVGNALDTRTPVFGEDMRFIEFSPYWNVPISIARSEIIPHLRRDPGYFRQQGFEFVNQNGQATRELSDANLRAVQQGRMRIRQRPGPRNALGDIKFVFPNDKNIYLHHTPTPQLFDRYRRDFSHGCIRVEDPVGLAKFVLYDDPEWPEARIREAMARGVSRTIRLKQPIPVLITYSTVVVNDDKVSFFPDLYAQDVLLDQALKHRVRTGGPFVPAP
jgi:murein L,D-transpeptidase YcbB/YkuD